MSAHEVTDGPLDDHPVVQGVLKLVGHDAVFLSCEGAGQDLRGEAAVGGQGVDV
jgi:hypothetical protein